MRNKDVRANVRQKMMQTNARKNDEYIIEVETKDTQRKKNFSLKNSTLCAVQNVIKITIKHGI